MSVHRHLDHHSVLLKKRADYFFASRAYSRREVANFAELLPHVGPGGRHWWFPARPMPFG
jgi:hypothetical protein